VHDGKVVCPWHGWEFDPKTGSVGFNPEIRVASYPLKIENGQVLIQIE
jgi:nitrite reductase (NADH) small subunit